MTTHFAGLGANSWPAVPDPLQGIGAPRTDLTLLQMHSLSENAAHADRARNRARQCHYRKVVHSVLLLNPYSGRDWNHILAALAYALVNTLTPGHKPVRFVDTVWAVEKMRKIVRRTRLIRGISLFGAVANIATMFSVNKLPKEGSEYWYWQVRAAAQLEAEAVLRLLVEKRGQFMAL